MIYRKILIDYRWFIFKRLLKVRLKLNESYLCNAFIDSFKKKKKIFFRDEICEIDINQTNTIIIVLNIDELITLAVSRTHWIKLKKFARNKEISRSYSWLFTSFQPTTICTVANWVYWSMNPISILRNFHFY